MTPSEVADWFAVSADEVIETPIAWVFLTGERAFKVKKPVDFGFLDYTTLEKRRWALEREQAFNAKATAGADIYRGVHRITRDDTGLALDGAGETIEYALQMRRFAQEAVLSNQPWALTGDVAEALGRTIARLHAAAAIRPEGGGTAALGYTIRSNADLLTRLGPQLGEEWAGETSAMLTRLDTVFDRHAVLLERRKGLGLARHCHADLHLGNILLESAIPTLFDCIEFNDVLSDIDVQYDLAFLLMDLDFRRRRDAGVRVLSGYLDEAARNFGTTVYEGLAALPLMMAVRAGVRAHVCGYGGDLDGAKAYIAAARDHLPSRPRRMVAVGGYSGSGKSTFARLIAPGLGVSPGAVVLRNDEVRKRHAGVGPLDRLPGEAYRAGPDQTYADLISEAGQILHAGHSVALDATFLSPEHRIRAEAMARACGAEFHGVWLEAPREVLEARVAARTADASDADLAVLAGQLDQDRGPAAGWARVDASDLEASAKWWTAQLDLGD